jgi:alpha-glucoside transport system permease protein
MPTKLVSAADVAKQQGLGKRTYAFLRAIPTWVLWTLVVLWTIPTFGLFVNSFRTRDAQRASGWWTIFTGGEIGLTMENYTDVLSANATGGLWEGLLNSLAITIPATIIPIAIAAFAAYAFAWIDFRGREMLFIVTVSLLAIPAQMSLIPLLQLYSRGAHLTLPFLEKTITLIPDLDLSGNVAAVWLTHTGFALPFAIFLLHNYISGLPKDIFESAYIDGADHFKIFWRLVLPLSVPVLAAFAIFQFLWTWNDYLIALTMIGSNGRALPATVKIASLAGEFGLREHLLTAGAFISTILPLVVFFALQRYFVRGILAGSVKG